jgi:geranylgeranyl diphosphate synthase type II
LSKSSNRLQQLITRESKRTLLIMIQHSFKELSLLFEEKFNTRYFPDEPANLYGASRYILTVGGKRIRPVMCLMGNELVADMNPDTWEVAKAIELFHNFTLIHDDIMDKAPLRRGVPTVHTKYNESTALLSGDVMLVAAYECIRKTGNEYLQRVLEIFNKTAMQVCEGQQMDMDFEKRDYVNYQDYVKMIELKTSVLLAASLQTGSLMGGAGLGNQQHLYEFGRNLGIAFQIQDDYLDAFGDPAKFGKKNGGDIESNKKTFLLIQAMNACSASQLDELHFLLNNTSDNKIERVIKIYQACKVDEWAKELKANYMLIALQHLEEIAVLSARKKPLAELAHYLLDREM